MSTGSARRAAPSASDPQVMMDINTTPLIDVMLVLLVMLIITIPIQLHAVNLQLPVSAPPQSAMLPEKVQIDIDEKSLLYWQGVSVTGAQLDANLIQLAQLPNPPELHLRPHRRCEYAVFANVLSATKRRGLSKVAVIGSEQFSQ